MRYEYSEAAAVIAMLGAVVSAGVWVFGLSYGGTILENVFEHGWLLPVAGILYFVSNAITDHVEGLKSEDERRKEKS